MSGKEYAILDIPHDDDELQFQDFGLSSSGSNTQTHVFTEYPDSPGHQADTDKLLGEYQDDDESRPKTENNLSFWNFEFYQQFFDVDSKVVGDRIIWSMIPKPGINYLQSRLRPKPDLYGPFWICLTLVFAAAITGNISNYIQTPDENIAWRYDFHKVSLATFMVFSYGWLVPLILWSILRYRAKNPAINLLEFICLYGYSMSVLVPVCIVWTLPMVWLRWCVGIVGVVLSGAVLAKSVWDGMKGRNNELMEEDESESTGKGSMKKLALVFLLVVIVLHISIAMGFMFYFFREPLHHSSVKVPGASSPVSEVPQNISSKSEKPAISPTKRDARDMDPLVSQSLKLDAAQLNQIPSEKDKLTGKNVPMKDNKVATDEKPTESGVDADTEPLKVGNETIVKDSNIPVNSTFKIIVPPKTAITQ